MAFTIAQPSTDTTLRFGPSRTDIQWDGKSYALVSILPSCPDTAATYSVGVTQVAAEETLLFQYTTNDPVDPSRDDRVTLFPGFPWQYRTNVGFWASSTVSFPLRHTVTTSSVVQFELSAATSWTAASTGFSQLLPDLGYNNPLEPNYFTYEIRKSVGTAAQVVTFGKITRLPPNPYSRNVSVAGNTPTATLCFQ